MAHLDVLEPADYFKQLQQTIPQAKNRIVIAAMVILSGEQVAVILEQLKEALQRGVTVRILLDNYTRLTFLYNTKANARERLQQTLATLKELKVLGARVYTVGRIGIVPYRGRCHIKISIVDDDVYSFGGLNLLDEGLDTTDYMLHTTSKAFADCLEELVKRVGGGKVPLVNGEVEIDATHTILFDGGKPNNSLIYDRACELAGQAARVHYVSLTAPSGPLAPLLHSTQTTFYTNRPELMRSPDSWGQAFDLKKYRTITSYHGNKYLHAKFMLCEFANGRKAVLTGSHNFSYRGVAYGTQEIALESTDPALYDQLYAFMRTHIVTKTKQASS